VTTPPNLPEPTTAEPATCPHRNDDGTTCGQPMSYATTVREYHRVIAWDGHELFVDGQSTDHDSTDEPDSLFCGAGHEWAVPSVVYE
jgi:hypothetical protein